MSFKVFVYTLPIGTVLLSTIILTWFWCKFENLKEITNKKHVGILFRWLALGLSILCIVSCTLFSRREPDVADTFRLFPFYPIVFHEIYQEYFRTLFMNILLFYPFGLAFSFIIPRGVKTRMLLVTVVGFIISLAIEILQYRLHLGVFETDDLICNTVGAILGYLVYSINQLGSVNGWRKKKRK